MWKRLSHLVFDVQNGEAGCVEVFSEERNVEELGLAELRVVDEQALGSERAHAALESLDTFVDRSAAGRIGRAGHQLIYGSDERIVLVRRGVDAPVSTREIVTSDVCAHFVDAVEELERIGHDARNHEPRATARCLAFWKAGRPFAELLRSQILARAHHRVEITVGNCELGTATIQIGQGGIGRVLSFEGLHPIGRGRLVPANFDEGLRETPELVAKEVAIRVAATTWQVEREHALMGTNEIGEDGAHSLQRIAGVRDENGTRLIDAARTNEGHRLDHDVACVRLEVTVALVTRNLRRAPDLDGMKPMRPQHRARVVNRHDGNDLASETSDVRNDFEPCWQGDRHAGSDLPTEVHLVDPSDSLVIALSLGQYRPRRAHLCLKSSRSS